MIAFYTGSRGNNVQFIWRIPEEAMSDEFATKWLRWQKILKKNYLYITHMQWKKPLRNRSGLWWKWNQLLCKKCIAYSQEPINKEQAHVDARVKLLFNIGVEDVPEAWDLCTCHTGCPEKFTVFWDECYQFLKSDIGKAPDDCHHNQVVHQARAISVCDLVEQVVKWCSTGTPIPIIHWVCLQFWTKFLSAQTALQYTGHLEVWSMVLACQFCLSHVDAHYAAAHMSEIWTAKYVKQWSGPPSVYRRVTGFWIISVSNR